MFFISLRLFSNRFAYSLLMAASFMVLVSAAPGAHGQRRPQGDGPDNQPLFSDFKGVRIGMTADDARKKLGAPRDKSDEADLYVYNDNEAVQVYYDKAKTVSAISIDFMSGANDVPASKDIIGSEPDAKADGSAYKLVRYPKAGYWVSYSKTAGSSPTITITMQKIEH